MKIDELKKALRGLIKEEVRKAVTEEVSRAMGKVLVEMVKEIKTNNHSQRQITESVEEPMEEIIHTNNPKLNSVLAETAKYSKPLQRTSEMSSNLAELMGGEFEKIGQSENVSYEKPSKNMDFLKQMVGDSPMIPQQKSVLDSGNEIPDALKSVFKKDFRAVMKKMDEQKKTGAGGFIDPSKVISG